MFGDRHRQYMNEAELQLAVNGVRADDAGLYNVTARTAAGESSREFELRVRDADHAEGDEPPTFLRRLSDLSVKVGTRTRFLVEIRSSNEVTVS